MTATKEISLLQRQINALDKLFNEYLHDNFVDLSDTHDSLIYSTLMSFYKRHLPIFKFPKDKNTLMFFDSEMIAFYALFKDYDNDNKENKIALSLCRLFCKEIGLTDENSDFQTNLFVV